MTPHETEAHETDADCGKASGSFLVASRGQTAATVGQTRYNASHSPVAQLVERLTVNQEVAGSSPARGANYCSYF